MWSLSRAYFQVDKINFEKLEKKEKEDAQDLPQNLHVLSLFFFYLPALLNVYANICINSSTLGVYSQHKVRG